MASATVTVRQEFIDAHARPITVEEVAAWADVTVFALRYSFRQHFGTTPEEYLRRIRLERAHQDLSNADPDQRHYHGRRGPQMGLGQPDQFNLAYLRRFGKLPGRASQN